MRLLVAFISFAKTLVGLAKTHTMALSTQESRYLHHLRRLGRGRKAGWAATVTGRGPSWCAASCRSGAAVQRLGRRCLLSVFASR
jgi:hypothetical protein